MRQPRILKNNERRMAKLKRIGDFANLRVEVERNDEFDKQSGFDWCAQETCRDIYLAAKVEFYKTKGWDITW